MLKRLLIFFVVHLLVITLVINTYSEASESPWDVRSMRMRTNYFSFEDWKCHLW